jgi:hypothetical protein
VAGAQAGERVFRLEETFPVQGLSKVRAARVTGEASFRPAEFRADKKGWVIVAENFEAYKAEQAAKAEKEKAEKEKAAKAARAKVEHRHTLDCPDGRELKELPLNRQIARARQTLTPQENRRLSADFSGQQAMASRGAIRCGPGG